MATFMKEGQEEVVIDEKSPLLLKQRPPRFGQRYLLVFLSSVGIAIIYCMRVNLSIALVAMVNSTAVFEKESIDSHLLELEPMCLKDNNSGVLRPDIVSSGEFAWSRPLQGVILSAFYWGTLLLQIPAGIISHRYGAKWLFGLGILWSSGLTVLIPFMSHVHPYALIALRAAQGIGEGVVYPALNTLIGLWVPPAEASLLTAIAFEGDAIGVIIGQVISGPLCASKWGWASSFYVCGGLGILWFIPWALLTTNRPETHPYISSAERFYITDSLGSNHEEPPARVPWLKILSDKGVWANFGANFSVYWVYFTLLTCLPQYFSDVLRFDIATNGLMASTPHAVCFIITIITAYLTDKAIDAEKVSKTVIRKILCFMSFSLTAGAITGVSFMGCNVFWCIVLFNVAVGALGLHGGGLTPNIYDLSPEFSGAIEALGNTIVTFAGIGAPYLTDTVTRHGLASQWSIVFYISAAIAMAGGLLFVFFGSAVKREWSQRANAYDVIRPMKTVQKFSSASSSSYQEI